MTSIDTTKPYVRAYAPGRTELAGNHMDHQGGRVIAATLDCGIEIAAQPCGSMHICVESDGFTPVIMSADDIAPRASERNTTAGLVRGVVAELQNAGVPVGGFSARVTSTIPIGGGFSSSAAFELALANALYALADDQPERAQLASVDFARIGLAAEQKWFGKPCGLMDQLAIATGGINEFDFAPVVSAAARNANTDMPSPSCTPLEFDFEQAGYALLFVNTHCDHSLYAGEFEQLARDMAAAARCLSCEALCELDMTDYLAHVNEVRRELGDLAALRALHFFRELGLVDTRARALRTQNMREFIEATRRSSASSAQHLQNVSIPGAREQPAMLALALADSMAGPRGAARIHGGGFGGSIQAFVPLEHADAFASSIDSVLGSGSCQRWRIANTKASAVWVR